MTVSDIKDFFKQRTLPMVFWGLFVAAIFSGLQFLDNEAEENRTQREISEIHKAVETIIANQNDNTDKLAELNRKTDIAIQYLVCVIDLHVQGDISDREECRQRFRVTPEEAQQIEDGQIPATVQSNPSRPNPQPNPRPEPQQPEPSQGPIRTLLDDITGLLDL